MNTTGYPKLYELNTRVFLRRFDTAEHRATLQDIPNEFWDELANLGFGMVWLMGVWKTNPEIVGRCCFEEGLMKSYDRALRNWRHDDVIGSPYAIDAYEISPETGTAEELARLRSVLAERGMKLILDFIPNHFSAGSRYLQTNPRLFLQCGKEQFQNDVHTFFRSPFNAEQFFAHGRDPFFPAWTDTVQVNYFYDGARDFMRGQLLAISALCDGVRCDMAMLALENVFQNTWSGTLQAAGCVKPSTPFWGDVIAAVTAEHPHFLFIAETYWDLEWDLQQLGFHFTYDKRLYDRLKNGSVSSIAAHLRADAEYQERLVRFIENHDEERAVTAFGKERALAAAVIMGAIPGMKLYLDGQLEGKRIKLPVQLGREPEEPLNKLMRTSYEKLLTIFKAPVFCSGKWELLEPIASAEGNHRYENMLAMQWRSEKERALIVVNYSSDPAQCRIQLPGTGLPDEYTLVDLWTDKTYTRAKAETSAAGLYVDLPPWAFHIFTY